MSVISVFAIISVVLLFIGFWVSLITDFDSYIGIIILFCGLILAGITYFAGIHNKEVINTETVEAESTKTETDNAVEELIDSFKGEERVAWRILKDWVEAQMALLDIQMVRFEEIFLPYIETENGQTIYERLEEKQFLLKAIN